MQMCDFSLFEVGVLSRLLYLSCLLTSVLISLDDVVTTVVTN